MNTATDVLIVGAGSAGSVLAECLSADPSRTVTVLEAGPDRHDPAIRTMTDNAAVLPIGPGSPVARHYPSTLTADPVRHAEIVRGCCLGGSGSVNGGYFSRALPEDFSRWAAPGWAWADVEPHYRAVEDRIGAVPATPTATSTRAFVDAARAAGYTWGTSVGPGIVAVPVNIVDGYRRGPGAVFLEPALGRPNLAVLTGIRVRRLIITGGRVDGVEAEGPDGPVRLHADRTVLCAGALETARLLMLSGIGPADELTALGIAVLADLPVGQRCWDHPEWVLGTGWPDTADSPVLEAVLVTEGLEIRPYTKGFGTMTGSPDGAGPQIGVALMRPRARGRVSLTSADPGTALRIEHHYDSEPADIAGLRAGCRLVDDILSGATSLGQPAWSTSQHLGGSAPIGAVVDDECRVLGIEGLWVADGSVLPGPTSRGPHASIAMVAHRAGEFV